MIHYMAADVVATYRSNKASEQKYNEGGSGVWGIAAAVNNQQSKIKNQKSTINNQQSTVNQQSVTI